MHLSDARPRASLKAPRVSVIIPTYNRRDFLPAAVESVLNQSMSALELIVVDDGSTDETAHVVSQLGDRRLIYLRQRRSGVSAARNAGIRQSRAPWIALLDSDDRWEPRKLERQLEALESRPSYRACCTDETWIRRGRRVNPRRRHAKFGGWIYHRCLPLCIISPSSVLLHRDLLERTGLFDPSFPVCEDYELWLRLTCRFPVLYLPERLVVKFGGHAGQLSQSRWGLDLHRVRALIRIYRSGHLTAQQRIWTAAETAQKALLLAHGFQNHEKISEARLFHRLAERWAVRSRWSWEIAHHSPARLRD